MRMLSSSVRRARFAIAFAVLILVSSVLPGEGDAGWGFHLVAKINPTVQNLLHIPVYAVLAVLLDGSLPGAGTENAKE